MHCLCLQPRRPHWWAFVDWLTLVHFDASIPHEYQHSIFHDQLFHDPNRNGSSPKPKPPTFVLTPLTGTRFCPLSFFFVFPGVRCGDERSKNRGRSHLSCTSCLLLLSPPPLPLAPQKEFQRAALTPSPVAATASARADDLPGVHHRFRCRRGRWGGAGQAERTAVRRRFPRDRGLPLRRGRGRARRPRACFRFLLPALRRWRRLCDHR